MLVQLNFGNLYINPIIGVRKFSLIKDSGDYNLHPDNINYRMKYIYIYNIVNLDKQESEAVSCRRKSAEISRRPPQSLITCIKHSEVLCPAGPLASLLLSVNTVSLWRLTSCRPLSLTYVI